MRVCAIYNLNIFIHTHQICASVIDFPLVKFYSHPRILFNAALAHLFCVLSFWRVPSANTPLLTTLSHISFFCHLCLSFLEFLPSSCTTQTKKIHLSSSRSVQIKFVALVLWHPGKCLYIYIYTCWGDLLQNFLPCTPVC